MKRQSRRVRQGLAQKNLKAIFLSRLLCAEWIARERMAVRRSARGQLGEKMGDHVICHPNQDTCVGEQGCYQQFIWDNRHSQALPLP